MKIRKKEDQTITVANHSESIRKTVLIENGDIPQLTNFGTAVFQPGQKVEPHQHATMYEVFYCTSGEIQFMIDGRDYVLKAGDCITIEPGEMHALENLSDEESHLTYFGIAHDAI